MKSGTIRSVWEGGVFLLACMFLPTLAQGQPDTIVLDDMSQYYQSVEFDHMMHVELLGDDSCAVCHHHTVGTPLVDEHCKRCHAGSSGADSVACRDCHSMERFSAEYLAKMEADQKLYHEDKPGLKGAFHQRCLGCHQEMGIAADCQVCHARTNDGDKFFHAGEYAPEHDESSSAH